MGSVVMTRCGQHAAARLRHGVRRRPGDLFERVRDVLVQLVLLVHHRLSRRAG